MYTQNDIHKIRTASPLVYNNMGWLGTAPTEGRVARADGGGAAAVVPPMVLLVHPLHRGSVVWK